MVNSGFNKKTQRLEFYYTHLHNITQHTTAELLVMRDVYGIPGIPNTMLKKDVIIKMVQWSNVRGPPWNKAALLRKPKG